MTPDPTTVASDASTWEAQALLQSLQIRHLPVVEGGALVGILSDRDLDNAKMPLDEAALDQMMTAARRPISAVMTTSVVSVHPETSVPEVIEQMLEHRVGAVPVVEPGGDSLLGIVSYVDVLRVALPALSDE